MGVGLDPSDERAVDSFLGQLRNPSGLPELARVAALLRAVEPPPASPASVDQATIAAMVSTIHASVLAAPEDRAKNTQRRGTLRRAIPRPRLARTRVVLGLTAGLMLFGGGFAFAGALPAPLQDAASHILQRVGIHVPEKARPSASPSPSLGVVTPPSEHPAAGPASEPSRAAKGGPGTGTSEGHHGDHDPGTGSGSGSGGGDQNGGTQGSRSQGGGSQGGGSQGGGSQSGGDQGSSSSGGSGDQSQSGSGGSGN
jgi:hypothetical protein